jgi:hypothetical protein
MTTSRTCNHAYAGAFPAMLRFTAACGVAVCKALLAAMHESRQREAQRLIARNAHLYGGADNLSLLDTRRKQMSRSTAAPGRASRQLAAAIVPFKSRTLTTRERL